MPSTAATGQRPRKGQRLRDAPPGTDDLQCRDPKSCPGRMSHSPLQPLAPRWVQDQHGHPFGRPFWGRHLCKWRLPEKSWGHPHIFSMTEELWPQQVWGTERSEPKRSDLLPEYVLQCRELRCAPAEASIKVLVDFSSGTTKLWHFKGFFYGAYPANKHHPFLSTGEPASDFLTALCSPGP